MRAWQLNLSASRKRAKAGIMSYTYGIDFRRLLERPKLPDSQQP